MMKWHLWMVVLLSVALSLGCSDDSENSENNGVDDAGNNGVDDAGNNGRPDGALGPCSNVDCGRAPLCDERCQSECGCCNCGIGDTMQRDGKLYECIGECWDLLGDAPDAGGDTDASGDDMGNEDMGAGDMAADVGDDTGGADMSTQCVAEVNTDNAPTDTCTHGAADWIAFRWEPMAGMTTVASIEIHTDAGEGALLTDDQGSPDTVLFTSQLSQPDPDGWRTFVASSDVTIDDTAAYWIAEKVGTCSTAVDGPMPDYYTSDSLNGPWSGPFNGHEFTARVHGTCMP